jgi:hypothetical protein
VDGVRCATALLESVAVAGYLEDVHVIGEAVEQGAGEPFGAKDLGPFLEGQVQSPSPVQRPIGKKVDDSFFIDPTFLHNRRSRYQCRAQCFCKSEVHFL